MHRFFNFFFLITSLFLLLYTFYRAEIIWSGDGREYYYIYYFVSIILVIFSLIFFFLNSLLKTYIIIFFTTTLISLYSFETFLNLPDNRALKTKIKLYKDLGKDFDTRTIRQVYNDLKKTDKKASVKVSPKEYLNSKNIETHPLSGISNSKTVYQNENGYYMIYTSDRYGFNNPDYEWDSKEVEYLLIGDSATHGAAVNRPDDIASQLRILSSNSVLSLGYSGNGPLIEYAGLREYAPKNVKKIIWLFTDNDISALGNELESQILTKYLKDPNFTQNLKSRQEEINELVKKKIINSEKSIKKFNFFRFLKIYKVRSLIIRNNQINEGYGIDKPAEFIEIIKLTKKYAKNNGAEFYFVYLPLAQFFNENYDYSNYEGVKKIMKDLNVSFIDINDVFDKEKDPKSFFPFRMFGHYNPAGYHKVSKAIFDLTNNK
jgi:hypothetical protein